MSRLLGQQCSDVDGVDERKIDQVWQDMKWLGWCCCGGARVVNQRGEGMAIALPIGIEAWKSGRNSWNSRSVPFWIFVIIAPQL